MGYFNKKIELIKYDKFLKGVILFASLLVFLHSLHFFYAIDKYQCLFRAIFFSVFIIMVFFFQRRGFSAMLTILGCVLLYLSPFYNYTSFICILIAIQATEKIRYFALIAYALNLIIAFQSNGRLTDIIHLVIHLTVCCSFYYSYRSIKETKKKHIALTEDEAKILEELRKGKAQKEIDFFSQNTIVKKLQEARVRNNIATTQELLLCYIDTQSQYQYN